MEPPSDVPSRLELLVRDYDRARSDAAILPGTLLTGMGVGVTVLAGVAAVLTQACRPEASILGWLRLGSESEDCFTISPYVLAMIPTLPVSLLAVMTIQGALATVRARYVRVLEIAIREEASVNELVPYGLAHLLHPLDRSKSIVRSHRLLAVLQWLPSAAISIFVGVGAIALVDVPALQVVLAGLYGLMAVGLIRGLFHGYIDISKTWRAARGEVVHELRRTSASFPSGSRWMTYRNILVPRPTELVVKAPIHFLAFVVASASSTGQVPVLRVLLFTFLLEYVVYQARYALNDLRDLGRDERHPDKRRRLRLERSKAGVRSALAAVALRFVAFSVLVLFVLPPDLARSLLVVGSISVVLSVGYESAKARLNQRRDLVSIALVLLLVGSGYAVRVAAGLHLGGVESAVLAIGVVYGYLLGLQIVWMTWALEGASFDSDAQVSDSKPHVATLTRLPLGTGWQGAQWSLPLLKLPMRWRGWRNGPYWAAMGAALLLGLTMVQDGLGFGSLDRLGILTVLVVGFGSIDWLVGGRLWSVAISVSYFLVSFAAAVAGSDLVMLFPLSVVAVVQAVFRLLTYEKVQIDFERLWRVSWYGLEMARYRSLRWTMGDDAFLVWRGETYQQAIDALSLRHRNAMARLDL